MSFLTVHHSTIYTYREPVRLGEHRMMFRPRASHDLRLIETGLTISPEPTTLRWLHDSFDNSVAVATFTGTTSELRFESNVALEHYEATLLEYPLEEQAQTYPFRYSDEDFPNLALALAPHYRGENVAMWALQFLDVAANGDRRDVQTVGQILERQVRVLLHQFQDLRVAIVGGHVYLPRSASRGTMRNESRGVS